MIILLPLLVNVNTIVLYLYVAYIIKNAKLQIFCGDNNNLNLLDNSDDDSLTPEEQERWKCLVQEVSKNHDDVKTIKNFLYELGFEKNITNLATLTV